MIKNITVSILAIFLQLNSISQNIESFTIQPSDLDGVKATTVKFYGSDELWEYINGGADIYLEYGFNRVLAQEIEWQGSIFRIDAYQMENPQGSFGIFSILKTQCLEIISNLNESCLSQYQIQLVIGNIYLSVVPLSGKKGELELAKEIAKALYSKNIQQTQPKLSIPEALTKLNANILNTRLIIGQLGMQNGAPEFEKAFSGLTNYQLWISDVQFEGKKIRAAYCKFQSKLCKEKALMGLSNQYLVTQQSETDTEFTLLLSAK